MCQMQKVQNNNYDNLAVPLLVKSHIHCNNCDSYISILEWDKDYCPVCQSEIVNTGRFYYNKEVIC